MLSTPPAFILSQDQTLMFKSWFFQNLAWLNFRIQSRRTVTVFGCVFFWKRCDSAFESRSLNYSLTNLSRLFHCSVFNVLCLFDSLFILSKCFRRVKIFFNFFIFHHSVISRAIYILSCRSCFVNTFLSFFLSFCLHPTVSDKSASDERRRRDLNPRAAVNDLHPFQGCPFGQLGYFSE